MWGLVLDVAYWGAAWMVVAVAFGILLGKCIAVGMGRHPRAPYAEESTADDTPSAEPDTSDRLLAEVEVLTNALADAAETEAVQHTRWRKTG